MAPLSDIHPAQTIILLCQKFTNGVGLPQIGTAKKKLQRTKSVVALYLVKMRLPFEHAASILHKTHLQVKNVQWNGLFSLKLMTE